MSDLTRTLAPSATDMIRADHTRVVAAFHRYKADSSTTTRQALVSTICLMLEIHAQVEEEIFYPAIRAVSDVDADRVDESLPEHQQMRVLIERLRGMSPDDALYDETVMELMRDVLHHVADEETELLPDAERLIPEQLGDLGARMMKRRLELHVPHAADLARDSMKLHPAVWAIGAVGVLLGASLMSRRAVR